MKTIIAYTRVIRTAKEQNAPVSTYDAATERFFRTYKQFKPTQPHELVVIDCGGIGTAIDPAFVDGSYSFLTRTIQYYGHGWDCGAYQFAANALDCDLLVCCNSWVHFHCKDWLYPLIMARAHYGPGLYGVSASYERSQHLRTPCIAFSPELVREYPIAVMNREACNDFEASSKSITLFAERLGLPAYLMMRDGAYKKAEWRLPELQNIFRRGDQSGVLVWDRHVDAFNAASPEEKARLTEYAGG